MQAQPSQTTALRDRRNNFDVTDRVNVSSMDSVRNAVETLFTQTFPEAAFDRVWLAFHDFQRLFSGGYPGYHGCDTTYHDVQHTLDMTLAVARLIAGHERTVKPEDRLGPARAELALIISMFHDAGYIRHETRDRAIANGAVFTRVHVTRSSDFLRDYLTRIGLAHSADIAARIVHFTGYEIDLRNLAFDDQRDTRAGFIIGTGDLLAQMADRCYLEKCRDRLYHEFVIGGIAMSVGSDGESVMQYESGEDLLKKTPTFFQNGARKRLDEEFQRTYRFIEPLFDGRNPYIEAINRNIRYLQFVIDTDNWAGLRREPPVYVAEPQVSESIRIMVAELRRAFKVGDSPQQVA